MIMILLSDGSYRSTEREYREGQEILISVGGHPSYATVIGVARSIEEAAQLANSAGPILQHFHVDHLEAPATFRKELVEA